MEQMTFLPLTITIPIFIEELRISPIVTNTCPTSMPYMHKMTFFLFIVILKIPNNSDIMEEQTPY
jgi:hypothetical protein